MILNRKAKAMSFLTGPEKLLDCYRANHKPDPEQIQKEEQLHKNLNEAIRNTKTGDWACTEMTFKVKDNNPFAHPYLNYLGKLYRQQGYQDVRYAPSDWFTGLKTPNLCVVWNERNLDSPNKFNKSN